MLTFRAVEPRKGEEAREITEEETQLLLVDDPAGEAHHWEAGGCRRGLSETLEASRRGGATLRTPGCRGLLRDAQVLPIWEGRRNVLALDAGARWHAGSLEPIAREAGADGEVRDTCPAAAAEAARGSAATPRGAVAGADAREGARGDGGGGAEIRATRRAPELALLVDHASWTLRETTHPLPPRVVWRRRASTSSTRTTRSPSRARSPPTSHLPDRPALLSRPCPSTLCRHWHEPRSTVRARSHARRGGHAGDHRERDRGVSVVAQNLGVVRGIVSDRAPWWGTSSPGCR